MIGIFCPANDLPALWAYQGLKRRGLNSLEVYTPEALVYNRRLEHRLVDNETFTRIDLMDGRVFEGSEFHGILNRITSLPVEHFQSAVPGDRQYAAQEQQAVFLSWLHGLPGVLINRPGGRGLCGDFRSPAEWNWLAGGAGLPTLRFHQSNLSPGDAQELPLSFDLIFHWIVLDCQIYGQAVQGLPEGIMESLSRFSGLSGLRLFGVDFCHMPDGKLLFVSATPLPDLRLGGEALVDALAEALK